MENKDKSKRPVGRPFKFTDPDQLEKEIQKYIDGCFTQKIDMFGNPVFLKDKDGKKTDNQVMVQTKPFTITGLAVFLDTSRETLLQYEDPEHFDGIEPEIASKLIDTIKKAKDMIHAYAEEFLYSGKNPTGAIFNLKNNWGWTDEHKYDHTSKGESIAPKVVSEISPHVKTETETASDN